MSADLRSYLLGLCAAALLAAIVMGLSEKTPVKRVVTMCCGLLMAAAVFRPIAQVDPAQLSQSLARIRMQAEQMKTGIEVKNRDLVAAIIKEKSEAYILDKASELGITLTADVTLGGDMTYPYPESVILTGRADAQTMLRLERHIEAELGIPKEKQTWKTP